jgi:hypothetical protein
MPILDDNLLTSNVQKLREVKDNTSHPSPITHAQLVEATNYAVAPWARMFCDRVSYLRKVFDRVKGVGVGFSLMRIQRLVYGSWAGCVTRV